MTTNEFERTARLFLELGPNTMPDRGLQAALDEIHVTRQRRAWWPARRFSSMPNMIRLAAGVAAVALVTVVGLSLIPSAGIGGFVPTPTPSPTATPVPTPTPSPLTLTVGTQQPLKPGTYLTADPFLFRVTFTLPAGWSGGMGGAYFVGLDPTSGLGEVSFMTFDKVRADPCHYDKGFLNPQVGPSVDDLANALASLPGLDATTPTDVSLGGYSGKLLTLTAPASFGGCTLSPDKTFQVWELPLGATYEMLAGERDRVWILDVAGQRLVIHAPELPGFTAEAKAQAQAILDSIRIAPAN